MRIDITDDKNYMILSSGYPYELEVITNALTVEIPNAWMLKKMGTVKNTERKFINEYNMVPVGLWVNVMKVCKESNFSVELTDKMYAYLNSFQKDYDEFKKYVDMTFRGAKTEDGKVFKPYDYQIKAAYMLLRYKKCCGEISTSAGKTLISFIIFKYLIDVCKIQKILYIVPNVDLATQSAEKYEEYESYLKKHNHNWEIGILKSNLTKKQKEKVESCNILFGTFQSLCKRDFKFFEPFGACINDETHHASSTSIKKILMKCVNLQYSLGVTGTFPKEGLYENLIIQSYIGPVVYKFTANELINTEKRGTPVYVLFKNMNWATQDEKRLLYLMRSNKDESDISAGSKVLREEQKFVNSSYTRLKYICDLAIQTKKNTLIIFGDVKGGYGKRIYNYIKENSDKSVYYIDGFTPPENREWMTEQFENDLTGQSIIVGSLNCCSEGIDYKNMWSIFLVNTSKSERQVRQMIGRGLRLYPGKDKVVLFDFVDDLRYSESGRHYDNYLYRHYRERKKIYTEQNFPVYEEKIRFENSFELV